MSLKKAELHVHLEGTITPVLAKTLAQRNRLQLPEHLISADSKSFLSRDFLHFLKVYDVVADLIKKPQDYYDITFDYLQESAKDHCIYVEMMYSPDHAEQASGIPSIEHLQAIQQAIDDAESQFGIIGRIIITAVRHFGATAAERVAKEAAIASVPCATGFGLGGDEANFPPELFKKAYQMAHDAGLECTIHAGEFAPANKIVDAIENLPIKRIGHGIHAVHSPSTMALIKERDIALELSPTSNVSFGIFKSLSEHPLPKFLEYGIPISVNTDDPPFVSTRIGEEYKKVAETFNLSRDTMHHITEMAIAKAFVDDTTRERLGQHLRQ